MLSLLGIAPQLELPLFTYDSTGTTQYVEATDAFDINATPLFYVDPVFGPSFVTGTPGVDINISVDDTGALIGAGTATTREYSIAFLTTAAIPEPATMCALGLAVAGLGGYIRRRRRA